MDPFGVYLALPDTRRDNRQGRVPLGGCLSCFPVLLEYQHRSDFKEKGLLFF